MPNVKFAREFRFSPDGHTILTYPPGEAEVSEICAEIARSDGALVPEEADAAPSEPSGGPPPTEAPEKAASKSAPEKKA